MCVSRDKVGKPAGRGQVKPGCSSCVRHTTTKPPMCIPKITQILHISSCKTVCDAAHFNGITGFDCQQMRQKQIWHQQHQTDGGHMLRAVSLGKGIYTYIFTHTLPGASVCTVACQWRKFCGFGILFDGWFHCLDTMPPPFFHISPTHSQPLTISPSVRDTLMGECGYQKHRSHFHHLWVM